MNVHLTQGLKTHYNEGMDEYIRDGFYKRGQIGLIVLLIGTVLLTLGIGVASQTVLETQTARLESESSSVFNVAEKLVEQALSNLSEATINEQGFRGTATVTEENKFTAVIEEGGVGEVILDGVAGGTTMTVEWPNKDSCASQPALVVAVIYGVEGENVQRFAYDSTACADDRDNGFTPVTCLEFCSQEIIIPAVAVSARIKALYADAAVTVSGSNFPTQSRQVVATATQDGADETRSIEAERGNPSLPVIFDYALYSGTGSIVK